MPDVNGRKENLGETAAYGAFASMERLAMALPESLGRRLFDAGGVAAFHLVPGARRVVEANLARVLGRDPGSPLVRATAREAFRSYARYWYDTFHARALSSEEVLRRVTCDGEEHMVRAQEEGRGAVMALPHLGNWDVAARWVHARGWKITAVAENLRPERLFELFLRHREELGMGVVALSDERKVGQELIRLLGQNHFIALVSDRDLKGRGVDVEMFGEPRKLPAGPALLALASGSPLCAAGVYDVGDDWLIHIDPVPIERTGDMRADVTTVTKELARRFERSIAAAPTQWHMFQPAWEPAPAGSASAAAGAASP
ncbi:MAG TPA: phosphatidylinositol mannoside acyltransferase [Actinomycetota bacterium]|nr:phosphatidylinositol mannoside acyltransferase [Actinomycetota bacterium]